MQTIGFIGVGNIGMVICKHLINSGHKVLGYRRSSLAEFEKRRATLAALDPTASAISVAEL